MGEFDLQNSSLVKGGLIEGVQLRKLDVNKDARGSFVEVFKDRWNTALKPVQFNVVESEKSVMRGCHLHWHHDEYFCILTGSASVGLRDERPNSNTKNIWSLYYLCEQDMAALVFPRGLVHGWYFHQDSIHLQAVSEAYDDYADYDNHLINWLDPDLQIPWPSTEATMTEKAQHAQTLEKVRSTFNSEL